MRFARAGDALDQLDRDGLLGFGVAVDHVVLPVS
jgi:hypothetical protein